MKKKIIKTKQTKNPTVFFFPHLLKWEWNFISAIRENNGVAIYCSTICFLSTLILPYSVSAHFNSRRGLRKNKQTKTPQQLNKGDNFANSFKSSFLLLPYILQTIFLAPTHQLVVWRRDTRAGKATAQLLQRRDSLQTRKAMENYHGLPCKLTLVWCLRKPPLKMLISL